jgi:1-acyl-sn-glycerol-3-phosphate acyltransferase
MCFMILPVLVRYVFYYLMGFIGCIAIYFRCLRALWVLLNEWYKKSGKAWKVHIPLYEQVLFSLRCTMLLLCYL